MDKKKETMVSKIEYLKESWFEHILLCYQFNQRIK